MNRLELKEGTDIAPQYLDIVRCHYEYIVVDPTEESDAGIAPVLVPDGFKVVPVTEADSVSELKTKYNELIMAVARKHPNETRHQTALRYIKNAESKAGWDNIPEEAMKGE